MKKTGFIAVFVFSNIVLNSSQKSPTDLVRDVHEFLQQFDVARQYKESKENFLQRLEDSNKFEKVIYTELPEKVFKKNTNSITNDGKKRKILGLVGYDACVTITKHCGLWGGDADGFYVSPRTNVVGMGVARFQERGYYEWIIKLPDQVSGNEFKNTPIQPLLNYLIEQTKLEVEIPLESNIAVSFSKEKKQIIARLQYKND